MADVLYHVIINLGAMVLIALSRTQTYIAQFTNWVGRSISPSQAKYSEAMVYQRGTLQELAVLEQIYKVRDAAVEEDDWSGEHYHQLNQIFQVLVQKHSWKKSDVDNQMFALVESGPPGYRYQPQDDPHSDEDDDDDYEDDDDYYEAVPY
jgi:hypothetical protein